MAKTCYHITQCPMEKTVGNDPSKIWYSRYLGKLSRPSYIAVPTVRHPRPHMSTTAVSPHPATQVFQSPKSFVLSATLARVWLSSFYSIGRLDEFTLWPWKCWCGLCVGVDEGTKISGGAFLVSEIWFFVCFLIAGARDCSVEMGFRGGMEFSV